MSEELSSAAINYGEAMCIDPKRQSLPFSSLTPEEQACVRGVGGRWEIRTDEAFGVAPPGVSLGFSVENQGGGRIGTLRMDDGQNVLLCVEGRSCAIVGKGPEQALAVEQALGLLGLRVGETPVNS